MTTARSTKRTELAEAIDKLHAKFPKLKFDFSGVERSTFSLMTPIKFHCTEHGTQLKSYKGLIRSKFGCGLCSGVGPGNTKNTSWFLDALRKKYPGIDVDFDLSKTIYSGALSPCTIICRKHGEIVDTANRLLSKRGKTACSKCNIESRIASQCDTKEIFELKAIAVHGDKYDYSQFVYLGNKVKGCIICKLHGSFYMRPNDHLSGDGCPNCKTSGVSLAEKELFDFVASLGLPTYPNVVLRNGKHVDILLPNQNLAIEYNGLFYHSEKFLNRTYHADKLDYCNSIGLRLIQIFEDEWIFSKEIVKNRLRALLGVSKKYHARECSLVKLSWTEAAKFLANHHVQGVGPKTSLCIGLKYKEVLVAVMTFCRPRFDKEIKDGVFELARFCSLGTVVGGFSKLVKAFEQEVSPVSLVSYSDRRWSQGDVYSKNGFVHAGRSDPGFFWCKGQRRENRMNFQKHKLPSVFPGCDMTKTADVICRENGWLKVFDCGTDRWEKVY